MLPLHRGVHLLEPEWLDRSIEGAGLGGIGKTREISPLVNDHRLGGAGVEVLVVRRAPRDDMLLELHRTVIERGAVGVGRKSVAVDHRAIRIERLGEFVKLRAEGQAVVLLVPHAPGHHARMIAHLADVAFPHGAVELSSHRRGALLKLHVRDRQLRLNEHADLVGGGEVRLARHHRVMPHRVEAEFLAFAQIFLPELHIRRREKLAREVEIVAVAADEERVAVEKKLSAARFQFSQADADAALVKRFALSRQHQIEREQGGVGRRPERHTGQFDRRRCAPLMNWDVAFDVFDRVTQ